MDSWFKGTSEGSRLKGYFARVLKAMAERILQSCSDSSISFANSFVSGRI
jgi:hypothetical protein